MSELTDEELTTAAYAISCELYRRRYNPSPVTARMEAAQTKLMAIQEERRELKTAVIVDDAHRENERKQVVASGETGVFGMIARQEREKADAEQTSAVVL